MHIIGVDLGQQSDYTAVALVEPYIWYVPGPGIPGRWMLPSNPDISDEAPAGGPPPLALRGLKRYALGTPYAAITDDLGRLRGSLGASTMVIDRTGVGVAVFELFERAGLAPVGVSIHGGDATTYDRGGYRVPKRDLVGAVQVALQNGRLRVAPDLDLWPVLKDELLKFKMTINAKTGHDGYAAWRERDHDDLVLALSLAVWHERHQAQMALRRSTTIEPWQDYRG